MTRQNEHDLICKRSAFSIIMKSNGITTGVIMSIKVSEIKLSDGSSVFKNNNQFHIHHDQIIDSESNEVIARLCDQSEAFLKDLEDWSLIFLND